MKKMKKQDLVAAVALVAIALAGCGNVSTEPVEQVTVEESLYPAEMMQDITGFPIKQYKTDYNDVCQAYVIETPAYVEIPVEKFDYGMNGKDFQRPEETMITGAETYYHFTRAQKNYANTRVAELVEEGLDEEMATKMVITEVIDLLVENTNKFMDKFNVDEDLNGVPDPIDSGEFTVAEVKWLIYTCLSGDALRFENDLSPTEQEIIDRIQGVTR